MSTRAVTPETPTPLEPIPFPVLGELLEQFACEFCHEPISHWEMAAIWPAGNFAAHLHCWAQHHGVVTGEASS
jgi:hypothetical protein